MWKANIVNKEDKPNEVVITVRYTDGSTSFEETVTTNGSFSSVQQFESQVASKIKMLNDKSVISSTLSVGEIVLPVETTPVKTQSEIDLELFMADYTRWLQVKKAIDAGILTGSETEVINLLNKVKGGFKIEYLNNI